MDHEQIASKLEQIEEQAQLTLDELPKHLTKERLRQIIALARFLRVEVSARRVASAQRAVVSTEETVAAAG